MIHNSDAIVNELKEMSLGGVIINTSGTTMFTLVGPDKKLMMYTDHNKNFNSMTTAEIDEYIESRNDS